LKSVGIDIGTSSIKVVEVTASNKGIQVSQFTEHPLNTNPAFDPEIEILEFLRGLAQTYDQATTKFTFSLRQEQVSVRNKIFPFSDRQKILKSLPFELEEDLPFSNDTAIYDAKVIRSLGSTAEVLACATPKTRVAAGIQKMQDSGLNVSILSAEGIAFANCFENWNSPTPVLPAAPMEMDASSAPERKIQIIVHIGHTRTLVCALENSLLIGVRSILWGGKNIADSIARRYEIPYVEALKEMQTKAFILPSKEGASYDQIVFSDTIAAQVKDLARELKISILEFRSEFNGYVETVGLTGGTSQILNLHAFLTQQLELPVNKTTVLTNFGALSFERTTRIDSVIGVALGLAVEGLKKPRNPALNFMKGEFALENTFFKVFWERWGTAIQVGAAAFVAFFVYSLIRESVAMSLSERTEENLKDKAKVVAALPSKRQNESGVKAYIRDQKKRANELRTLSSIAQMNSALDVLKKVNDAIPGKTLVGIDVRKLNVLEDQVLIEGVVQNADQVRTIEKTLKNIAIGAVTPAQAQPSKKPGVPFAFSFKVDRGISQVK
jgi:general secretion pathway protein L